MEEDRLSSLPKFILHDILSRLSQRDAARISVLSNAWADTWSTFPVLSIHECQIVGREINDLDFIEFKDYLRKRKKFCDKVERTLLRFYNQGLAIKQFKLSVNNFRDLSNDVELWLKLVTETGVEGIKLHQQSSCSKWRESCYIFPTSVFEAKSLTKLVLKEMRIDLTFINHPIKIFSLKVLKLKCVYLRNEEQLKHLISRCHLIEDITLACYVYSSGETHLSKHYMCSSRIKSLSLHGLPRLKSVDVGNIAEVNVDSLCLEKLKYYFRDPGAPGKIDFDRCRNLKRLSLVCSENTIITEKWFLELFLKCPILESLHICGCSMPKRINISSDRLKAFILLCCSNVNEINIASSNLLSCLHLGVKNDVVRLSLAFWEGSSQLTVNIEMISDYHNLCNFKEFIKKFVYCHVWPSISISLYIHWPIAVEFDPIILQVSPIPPPRIKHLVLQNVPDNEALYLHFFNRLLLCCCPTTISLSPYPLRRYKAFTEVFYEMLVGKNKDRCFCNSGDTKCWWHDLKGVKVSGSMKSGENVDFKTILDAFETFANIKTISFNLEF